MIDFYDSLMQMNNAFQTSKNLERDKFKPPFWIENDPLKQIYNNLPELYQSGKVVYAYIVQANVHLFKRFPPFNSPADIIFSLDDFYKSEPSELQYIAHELFGYKNTDEVPGEIKQIADSITNEQDRVFNAPLPLDFTYNRQIYFTTIMVHRNHLPKSKITSSILPIICDIERSNTAVILPKYYWDKDFIKTIK